MENEKQFSEKKKSLKRVIIDRLLTYVFEKENNPLITVQSWLPS